MHQFAKHLYNKNSNSLKDVEFRERNFCEIIHIGIVCSGFTSNIYFLGLLKGLFLTRSNPVHFHLLVSDDSDLVLRHLFKTWQVPHVNVSFYNMNPWLKDVRWVPNGHYSGNYGLLKLIFNKVIPSAVTTKLLIFDTDLTINGDIYTLWKVFDYFNEKQAIGIGENQSPYYLGQLSQTQPWPAIGIGFNSGVMLYDLEKLNTMKWNNLWVNLTKRYSLIFGQTDLGDQDILNAAIVEDPDMVYKLPCYWNTQMSTRSTAERCYSKFKPKIIHWNSPQKYSVPTKDGDLFRGLANSMFELNGNWFRNYPFLCFNDSQLDLDIKPVNECRKFSKPANELYRTLLFVLDYKFSPDEWDITYVTHLSFDRIFLLENIAKIWTGPISFTLYLTDAELARAIEIISESEILSSRSDIAYHAVFKQGELYPINTLRNTGLKFVKSQYVFLVDADFVPMKSLFEILKDNIKSMGDLTKKALVVPAFEPTSSKTVLPKSKIELIGSLERKEVRPFLADVWQAGHAATDYEKWKKEYEPYQINWQAHYEPYIVVKKNVVPYDERFLGFGWNKVSHIMELEAQNYDFIVLSDVFIIHQPHSSSEDNSKYKQSALYRRCIQSLKRKFVHQLSKKYNKNFNETINYSEEYQRYRKKRGANTDSTTTRYDSTDYFLTWGGKEKAERKKELRKKIAKPSNKNSSKLTEYDYYYYESEFPYNLTVLKTKPKYLKPPRVTNMKEGGFASSEEHDYEYEHDDLKFKELYDMTTIPFNGDKVTILSDADLIPHEKDFILKPVDEKAKNISSV